MQIIRNNAATGLTSGQKQKSVLPLQTVPKALPRKSILLSQRLTVSCHALAAPRDSNQDLQDAINPKMMCYQCEQTMHHEGCTSIGNCGKTPEVAGLQDLLVFSLKGLGSLAVYARERGITDAEVDSFCLRGMFSTLTNVNFDDSRFEEYIVQCVQLHSSLSAAIVSAGHPLPTPPDLATTNWFEAATGHPLAWNDHVAVLLASGNYKVSMPDLLDVSRRTGILYRQEVLGKTVAGLQELICYGLKGMAAYAAHAEALGGRDPQVYAAAQRYLHFLGQPGAEDVGKLLETALALGKDNFRVMQLLNEVHVSTFGHPVPTSVTTVPRPGKKCILVTGHDMHDLHTLLQQTEGMDIDVYTHGEMLPAHGYPGLKKYKNLVGHYGGAWYRQKIDFAQFPGPVVVTTNCVLEPLSSYRDNLFTLNETGLSNINHIGSIKDFSAVIARAEKLPGWTEANIASSKAARMHKESVTVGFGHNAVLGVADKVLDAVHTGKLRHIFLVGGCDGNEPQRGYYHKLGEKLPKDTMLLTLGCGKFRILDQEFGTLADTGLPRLLDMGQCNDAYSALVVATELAKALNTDINSLPLSLDLSWFEQKAVAVLLTLLHLGVKDIRLGPAMPAFLTKEATNVLIDMFNLKPGNMTDPEGDLRSMMSKA